MSSDDDSDYSSDDDHYVEEVEPEELPQQDAGERRVLGGVDDVFGGGGEAEQPAAKNPLRQCVDFLVALPPFTRAWLVVLVLTACATWYLGDKHPRGKRMLALHWGRALGPKREWWRLLTTFGTLGGQEASVRSLMACGMIYESLAPHEHNMRALGRYRRFGACVVVSAALLLGSQYFGVRRRWYALAFQRAGAADWANTVRPIPTRSSSRRGRPCGSERVCGALVSSCGEVCSEVCLVERSREMTAQRRARPPHPPFFDVFNRRGWGARSLSNKPSRGDAPRQVGASYFLSHDLIFCLLCAPCWEHPHLQINLAFLPGVGPFRMWQLPFVLASVQVLIGGSVRHPPPATRVHPCPPVPTCAGAPIRTASRPPTCHACFGQEHTRV